MNKAKEQPKLAIRLDTNLKQITVEGNVNLEQLYKNIKKLLPEGCPFGSYKEYELVTNNNTLWYPYYIYQSQPNWWTYQPYTTSASTNEITYTNGTSLIIEAMQSKAEHPSINTYTVDNSPQIQEKGVYYFQMETQIG